MMFRLNDITFSFSPKCSVSGADLNSLHSALYKCTSQPLLMLSLFRCDVLNLDWSRFFGDFAALTSPFSSGSSAFSTMCSTQKEVNKYVSHFLKIKLHVLMGCHRIKFLSTHLRLRRKEGELRQGRTHNCHQEGMRNSQIVLSQGVKELSEVG